MIASVRDEFPGTEGLVYLDVAARSLFPCCWRALDDRISESPLNEANTVQGSGNDRMPFSPDITACPIERGHLGLMNVRGI